MTLSDMIQTNPNLDGVDVSLDEQAIYDLTEENLTEFETVSPLDHAIKTALLSAWRKGHVRAIETVQDGISRAIRSARR